MVPLRRNDGGWIGVDLDSTLAHFDRWRGIAHIGAPIAPMVERVKRTIEDGVTVKLFTARVAPPPSCATAERRAEHIFEMRLFHVAWAKFCAENGLPVLEVTCQKDFKMIELWDDRVKQVVPNAGVLVEDLLHECRIELGNAI